MDSRGEQELLKEIQYLTSKLLHVKVLLSFTFSDIMYMSLMADLIQSHGGQGSMNANSRRVSSNQYHWNSQYVE